MDGDEEEELALLRSARASRTGISAESLEVLKAKQQRAAMSRLEPAGTVSTQGPAGGNGDSEAEAGPFLEEEAIIEAGLRQQFPLSFGEQETRAPNLETVHAGTVRVEPGAAGPFLGDPNTTAEPRGEEEGLGPVVGPVLLAEEGSDEETDPYNLPISHEVTMQGHSKAVSCVDVEHSGSRLLSGSRDNSLRIFDFNGMKSTMQSFRQLEPSEGHPMLGASWSPTGDAFLAVSGSAQVKIYDRDGHERGESIRGDMYIRDQRNTKGHISPATGGKWNPTDRRLPTLLVVVKHWPRDQPTHGVIDDERIRHWRATSVCNERSDKVHGLVRRVHGILRFDDVSWPMASTGGPNARWKASSIHVVVWSRNTAMTCSEDGTIRLWDTANVVQKTVIKPLLQRAVRVSVSACAYNANGSSIAGGLVDGSIHIWDAKGSKGRSAAVDAVPVPKAQMIGKQDWRYVSGGARLLLRGAHPPGTEITSLAFSQDNLKLLSRAADDTLKVWDLRKFKAPLRVFDGLPNTVSTTGVCFGPDDRLAVTGTSAGKGGVGGSVVFVDLRKEAVVRMVGAPSSVVALHWSQKLNQIFVGVGDKSSGAVRVLYSPTLSERGVLLCAHRKPRSKDPQDFQAPLVIHTPHALPLFREPRGSKRHLDAKPKDAAQRFKPDVGSATLTGTGTGGRIGATGGTLLTQYVLKNQGQLRDPKEEDVRAKILRHSGEDDDKTSKLFSKAYEKTQPTRIFAEEEDEGEKK